MSRDKDDEPRPQGPRGVRGVEPSGPGAAPGDDPDAPPSEEELRAAAALRQELEGAPGARPSQEAAWLRAHLRPATWEDSLGEVRARGLARAAREQLQARRAAQAPLLPAGLPPWRQLRRALIGTGGLLASTALLLLISSVLLEQAGRPPAAAELRAQQAELLRASLLRKESPSQRLDLVIEERLQVLRQTAYGAQGQPPRRRGAALGLAPTGVTP